jgi:hypothetical protein
LMMCMMLRFDISHIVILSVKRSCCTLVNLRAGPQTQIPGQESRKPTCAG